MYFCQDLSHLKQGLWDRRNLIGLKYLKPVWHLYSKDRVKQSWHYNLGLVATTSTGNWWGWFISIVNSVFVVNQPWVFKHKAWYWAFFFFLFASPSLTCCSVIQSFLTLGDPRDCSTSSFPVLHHLPQLAQTHIHWVTDFNWGIYLYFFFFKIGNIFKWPFSLK